MTVEIERPEQVWVGEFTYFDCQPGPLSIWAVLMGLFTGRIPAVGTWLGQSMDQEPDSHRPNSRSRKRDSRRFPITSGQGEMQYAGNDYVDLLKESGVSNQLAEVRQAWPERLCEANNGNN